MIPILYPAGETAFTSNGLGRLRDCISCRVTEERNGAYTCTFVYPISGRHYSDIAEGCIISCTHDDDGDRQPFRIVKRTAPINGQVTFYAEHLSYGLANVILEPFTASSAAEALQGFSSHAINTNPFTFQTDKATMAPFSVDEPASVRSCMGGRTGSILDVYGGEWDFDGWTVYLRAHRGMDSGVVIRYGKNLDEIEQTVDAQGLYNAVVPFWRQESEEGEDILVTLPEKIVTAEGVENPVPVALNLTDVFQEQPTEAELRAEAQRQLADGEPWLPSENIKLDFVALWQTMNYKDAANLQRVRLCDTVDVVYPELGVTARGVKVIKVVYDVLAEKYSEMELGEARATFADVLTKQTDTAIKASQATMKGFFDDAISTATDLITGGAGGHLVISRDADGKPQELLIMDTEDINTATNILRINLAGIGFSSDGGRTYATAWTLDGHFVADFITTGTLKAILLQGPTADTFWNLATGIFQNYGETLVTAQVETDEGVYTPTTYQIKHKTRIGGGKLTLDGHQGEAADENLLELGLAAEGMNYDFLKNVPSTHSTAYPYSGMSLRGARMTGEAGFGLSEENREVVKYNALGRYAPDFIVLGEAENITDEQGGSPHPGYMPDRNLLRMTGGWAMPADALVFEQYYKQGQDGTVYYQYDPAIYRPAWCYTLNDDIAYTEFYVTGNIANNRTELRFSIPLQRPIGDPKVKGCVISADLISVWQYNSKLQTRVDLSTIDKTWSYNNAPFDHQHLYDEGALQITLKKNSGNWGGTNDRPVLIWFDTLWLYFIDEDNHTGT